MLEFVEGLGRLVVMALAEPPDPFRQRCVPPSAALFDGTTLSPAQVGSAFTMFLRGRRQAPPLPEGERVAVEPCHPGGGCKM